MEKTLIEYFETLNSERCLKKSNEAGIIIDKICQFLNEEQNQFKMGFLIGLVLAENNGIFAFIWKTCSNNETVSSTTVAFKLLDLLVTKHKKITEPHFSFLFEKCLHLLNTKFAKVKELSLKLIKKLILNDLAVCLELSKLIFKLEKLLREDSKIPGTVLEQIFSILGIIFEKYPESAKKEAKWFFLKMTESLASGDSALSISRTRGSLEGIKGYLKSFSFPDTVSAKKIYGCIKKLGHFQKDKRAVSYAALEIFQNHWICFAKFVYEDRDYWKNCLSVWLHQNKEDCRCGFYVSCAFYELIAFVINQDSSSSEVSRNYLDDFTKALESGNFWEKKLALMGIKVFVLKNCLKDDDLKRSYQIVMNFARHQESTFKYAYVPLCIESISAFGSEFLLVESDQVECLARLSLKLVHHCSHVESEIQSDFLKALEISFYTVAGIDLRKFENHVQNFVYQGLIISCSSPNSVEEGLSKGEAVSCKSYFSFWKHILNLENTSIMPTNGSFTLKKKVANKIFDSFVNSFLKIITKLNFNVKSGVEEELELEMPGDFQIFINCVDLYQYVIPQTESFSLSKWMNKIFKDVIYLSCKNPLVAGFYKIIATTLKAADVSQFFEESALENDKSKCFESVRKFLESVLVKVDHYKNDLLIACLRTLLAAPVPLVEGFVERMVPALELIIHVGRGYFPLLKEMLDTLERWASRMPTSAVNTVMHNALPHLDLFFQSSHQRNNSNESGSELLALQKRFLIFLSNLNISMSMNLIESREIKSEERKISDKHVVYPLAFGEGKSDINLDKMVPRIIELAEGCSDQKTRLAACELLHSTVLVVLGYINQFNGGFTGLFRKITKTCLILSCDSDSAVSRIFDPLMYQIIHYFSGKKAMHFVETQDLLNILLDFASRSYEPATRDFAAVLVGEFTVWSIGQLSPEELKDNPDSIKTILNGIYSMSLHLSHSKRQGAALIFNKIYSALSDEDFFLKNYWFKLFYHFMESLRMCDRMEDVSEITDAIEHIKRSLIKKHRELNEANPHRVVPPEFEGNLLSDLIKWTLSRCYDETAFTRRTAMALVEALVGLDYGSLTSFVTSHLPEKAFPINDKFVKDADLTYEDFTTWLSRQSALFEYYNWLLKQNVMTVGRLFHFEFKTFPKKLLGEIFSDHEKNFATESSKRESILSFLNVLLAVGDKAFYFPASTWEILIICIFEPSRLGFDPSEATIQNTDLFFILTTLLKVLSSKLTRYDWDRFYENVESFMSVPLLSHCLQNRRIDLKTSQFLFALKVIESSGLWNDFKERMLFSIDDGLIVKLVFRSLFRKQKIIPLEPSCKSFLNEFLKLGGRVGVDWEEIFRCFEDSEEVKDEETGKTVKKGEYFQSLFSGVIFDYLEVQKRSLVDVVLKNGSVEVVKFLIQMLQNKKFSGSEVGREVCERWKEFERLQEKRTFSKTFLVHLAAGAGQSVGTPGCLKLSPVAEFIYSAGECENLEEMNVNEVEKIFGLIPLLSDFSEDLHENYKLDLYLAKLNDSLFSCGVSGSKKVLLQVAISSFLQTLKLTGSLVVLRFILRNASSFKIFCKEREIEAALSVFADSKTSDFHSIKALKLVHERCFKSETTGSTILLVYRWFLNPLLKTLSKKTVHDFMMENLESISDLITKPLSQEELSIVRVDIAKKTCCSSIVHTFVAKFSKSELDEMSKEKMSCIDKLVRSCFHFLRSPRPVKCLSESYRKLMCEIFNMICGVICAKCTDQKIYKLFIFDERGSFLYEAVNKTASYNLDMDFDEIPSRTKYLTSLRLSRDSQINEKKATKSIKHVQANTLFSSSLCEDVTKFDFTDSSLRPRSFFENVSRNSAETSRQMEIELELDSLNKHECMATLVGVITKMIRDGITPLPSSEERSFQKLPCWLEFLLSVLQNSRLCTNIKLFVLKCIYNVQDYAKPYCENVFPVLLKSVLSLFADSPINYFTIDLIEMMIDWRHMPVGEESAWALTTLVKLLMEKGYFFRRHIVKYISEILRTMIEIWKDCLVTSELSASAFKLLFYSAEKTESNVSDGSIKMCGILLSHGIPAWKQGSEPSFFDLVLNNFDKTKHREDFSEVCGLALKHLKEKSHVDLDVYENLVREKIANESTDHVTLLYGIHKHYPEISFKFIFKIFTSAWNSVDPSTVKKMEMLLNHVSRVDTSEDETFNRHVHVFLIDMLNSVDVTVQKISLEISEKLLDKMPDDRFTVLLRGVLTLANSVHPNVRKLVCEISAKYYLRCQVESDLKMLCKVVLLKGLTDGNLELEEFCLNFWIHFCTFLSPHSSLTQIFQKMYHPETEGNFLNIAIKILIRIACSSDRCKDPIFAYPITHDVQKQNSILTDKRMSALGSASRRIQSLESTISSKSRSFSLLQPTVSLKFETIPRESSGEIFPMESELFESPVVPKNPLKRRFFKSHGKANMSFAKWRKKQGKDSPKEEETELITHENHGSEDYPNIQISHLRVLKPLEALANRDHQICRQFLVAFYSGIIKSVGENERLALFSETNKFFEKVFELSTDFNPGVFGFIFQILLKYCQNLQIDCEKIYKAAVSSDWLSLGALLIEEIIRCKEDSAPEQEVKRRRGRQERRWLELAKLYRALEEFDIVCGIFVDKLKVDGDEKKGIISETFLNWSAATEHYESVLKSDLAYPRNEFYVESYFLCLEKLSNWSSLSRCIRTTVNEDLEKLWENYNLLSWFLKSEMMTSLRSHTTGFQTIMEEFWRNDWKSECLSVKFVEELAVFDWLSGNIEKAKYRIDRLYLDFLANWSHLNRWCYNLRAKRLTNLQTVSELNSAVTAVAKKKGTQPEQISKLRTERWERMNPAAQDDLTVWDVMLTYRRHFINQQKELNLKEAEARSDLELVKAALGQDNFSLAKEYLLRVKEKLPEVCENLKSEYNYYLYMGKIMLAKQQTDNENSRLNTYLNVWSELSSQIENKMETDSENVYVHAFRCNLALGKLVSEVLPLVTNQNVPTLCARLQFFDFDAEAVVATLKSKGLEYYEVACGVLEKLSGFESARSNSYLELSKFLLRFSDLSISSNYEKLGKYLLRSMSLGSAEARQLFGSFLNISINFDEARTEILKTECDSVPSWMFLMWVNQILASLTQRGLSFLTCIILRTAQDYPNAIRYAFGISKKNFENPKMQKFVKALDELLMNDKLYENFVTSIHYLCPPDMVVKHYLEKCLEEVSLENPNFSRIDSILKELYDLMFSPKYDAFRGPVFKFWENFKLPIEDLLGAGKGSWKSKIENILADIESSPLPSRRTLMLLESYSPWLHNFHSLRVGTGLELPGQYDGNRKPIQKYLVMVSFLKNDVSVFKSKSRPMKITILGNDAQEHKFLVKFGEDLRQDERFQQVFGHFNYRFNESKQTRRFSLCTYTVIPFTLRLGMIKWIENSISLHEMFENALGNDADLIVAAQNRHLAFLAQGSPSKGFVAAHLYAYENIKRESAILNFKMRVQEFRQDLLKETLWSLSVSPEHFIHLRTNFATSHAVMCITHWLIGIGDRHLQNILVSTETGRVVGIDFSYAFGFATQFLTPPELVPFRLTPQILNLMRPLKESGWLKQTMIYCLRLFRKKHFMVLSMLEVFALEPITDSWNQIKESSRSGHVEVWDPKQKISIVQQKLNGMNPVLIFEADLRAGHLDSKLLTKYLEVLKGVERDNVRSRYGSAGLTEQEQVECLIDLATDPHILAKTYMGWNSWL